MQAVSACALTCHSCDLQEVRHYRDTVLKQVLPPLLHASENAKGATQSRNGFVFPPYIVLERGIPLFEWAQQPRRQMEVIVMVEVLSLPTMQSVHVTASTRIARAPAVKIVNIRVQ